MVSIKWSITLLFFYKIVYNFLEQNCEKYHLSVDDNDGGVPNAANESYDW